MEHFSLISPGMALCLSLVLISERVRAQDEDETDESAEDFSMNDFPVDENEIQETVVHGHKVRPTDEGTGFGFTVEVEDSTKEHTTVSEVLSHQGGVQVRSTGGPGSSSFLSVRGSTPGHLPVYLDGVLLNSGTGSALDLSTISLDGLSSIQVYRGSTPPHLRDAGLGGAVSLVSRSFDEPLTEVSLSYGSWNTGRFTALAGRKLGEVKTLAVLSLHGSEGDFRYLNRNGTLLNQDDDRIQSRENNEHLSIGSFFKLDGEIGSWNWTLANDLFASQRGVAGIESIPTQDAGLRSLRDTVSARLSRDLTKQLQVNLDANFRHVGEDFSDVNNEIGVGAGRYVSKENSGGGGLGANFQATRWITLFADVSGNLERFDQRELVSGASEPTKRRMTSSFLASARLTPLSPLLVLPAYRLEHQRAAYQHSQEGGTQVTQDTFHQPSVGFRVEMIPHLFARGNLAHAVRAPGMSELFGDRGAVIGNPDLKAEKALNGDGGLTWFFNDHGPLDTGRLELVGFASKVDDLIVYVQNSQSTVRPENVASAHLYGVEAGGDLGLWGTLSAHVNYTYLRGINKTDRPFYYDKRLPGRPAHELYAKLMAQRVFGRVGAGLWVDLDYRGSNYLDQANLREDVLGRAFLGAGARVELISFGLTLTVEAKNLLDTITLEDSLGRDRPVRDYHSFPLPGRSIFATLNWRIHQ